MKKYLLGTSLLLSSIATVPVMADDDFYLSIGYGITYPNDVESDYVIGNTSTTYEITEETDNPGMLSVGFGKSFDNDFRVEFNFSKATATADSFTVTSAGSGVAESISDYLEYDITNYMVYGLKDFSNESKFTPYAGVGIGFASIDANDATATIAGTAYSFTFEEESVFSFAFKGGVGYKITDQTTLFTELGYTNLASFRSKGGVNYDSNELIGLTAGVKFSF